MPDQADEHAPPGDAVYPGLWECGDCHQITDESHYYEDRMTGLMAHCSDPARRVTLRARCGWSSTYGGYHVPAIRCGLLAGHGGSHDPQTHGFGKFLERESKPPYDPAKANATAAEFGSTDQEAR